MSSIRPARISKPCQDERAESASPVPGGEGVLHVLSGREAVNATEELICGAGAVDGDSLAEGLALWGRRSANRLPEDSLRESEAMAVHAPRVHHRLLERDATPASPVFELHAADAQQAVDLCFVAHRLVARRGEPVTCTLEASTARRLSALRLPESARVGSLIDEVPPAAPGQSAESAADEAFAAVGRELGRPCAALSACDLSGAEIAIVAMGEARARAMQLAQALRNAGIPCGVVGVTLWRPFPAGALGELLAEVATVLVLEPQGMERRSLSTEVRAALAAAAGKHDVLAVPADASSRVPLHALGRDGLLPESLLPHEQGDHVRVAVLPGGPFGRELLRTLATHLAWLGPLAVHEPDRAASDLSVMAFGEHPPNGGRDPRYDLLFAAHPQAIAVEQLAPRVADGAALLVLFDGASPEALWRALHPAQRRFVSERQLSLRGVDRAALLEAAGGEAAAARAFLAGALLSCAPQLEGTVGVPAPVDAPSAITRLGRWLSAQERAWVERGAAAVFAVEIDTEIAAPTPAACEPHMPAPASAKQRQARSLRDFHLQRSGTCAEIDPRAAMPLWPAAAETLAAPGTLHATYPLLLTGPDGATPVPLSRAIGDARRAIAAAGGSDSVLSAHEPHLLHAFAQELAHERDVWVPFERAQDNAAQRFLSQLDASPTAREDARAQLDALRRQLPARGELLDAAEAVGLRMHVAALQRSRRTRRTALETEVAQLIGELDALLQADAQHAPDAAAPDTLAGSLGTGALEHFDFDRLSRSLPQHRGPKRLSPARRARIERALHVLERERGSMQQPEVLILHAAPLPEGAPSGPTVRSMQHPSALEVALGLFDGIAADAVELMRAVRLSRLEVRGAYDEELHDAALQAFDADSLTEDELRTLPAVVVYEHAQRLRGPLVGALTALLRSGRPLQVLVVDAPFANSGEPLSREWRTGVGQLALAHRECFVCQSSLGQPAHLARALQRAADSLRPAVSVVAVPAHGALVPAALQLAVIDAASGTPGFVYDPDAGESWADRLDLSDHADSLFVERTLSLRGADGGPSELRCTLSFADMAALDPELRHHFLLLSPDEWSDDQREVPDYVAAWERGEARDLLPFVWVLQDDGCLARAVITRELAFAVRDRARALRWLQELGGVHNEWARRAVEAARTEAQSDEQRQRAELAEQHRAELAAVRERAAGEAMQRLVDALLDLDDPPSSAPAGARSTPPPAEVFAAPPTAPAAPAQAPPRAPDTIAVPLAAEPDDASFDEPYIDSPLCTSCNECINLNPRMFRYDDNKQATLADAAAGSYLQLVTAAEKCPARCIHPGAPRGDDATATAEVRERAEPFR